ncbi:MAG: hypothetical protein WAK97_21935, partial [Pseudolabrys sp.]
STQGVHRYALRMVSLLRDTRGNYKARKRLPGDVREEYGRLYGQSFEAKFHAPGDTKRQDAERQFHEWEAETNARIAAIRAEREEIDSRTRTQSMENYRGRNETTRA